MKTIIYFIRHGKTNNPKKIVKGWLPGFNLSKTGQKEVAKIGKYLSKNPIKYIFHSPLLRAQQTALIIKRFLPQSRLIKDLRLLEWQTSWEGKTMPQIYNDPQMQIQNYLKHPLKFRTAKGQTASQIVRQMKSFCQDMVKKFPGQEIIAVSHGDPIKLLRCYFQTGKISSKFVAYTCNQPSITSFIFNDGKFKRISYKSFTKKQKYFSQ